MGTTMPGVLYEEFTSGDHVELYDEERHTHGISNIYSSR
jgi:hypothetical protein